MPKPAPTLFVRPAYRPVTARPVESLEPRRFLAGDVGALADEFPGTLVPDVSASLPEAVVSGAKVRPFAVSVTVTNVAAEPYSGSGTVTLYVSANETFEPESDPQLALTTKRLAVDSGQSQIVKLKVKGLPALPDGDYRVIARVTAAGVDPASNASFNTVNVAGPFVDLSGAFGVLPSTLTRGKRAKLAVTLTNNGNTAVKTTVPVAITTAPADGTGQPAAVATVNARVALKAGQTRTVRLSVLVPAELAAGSYALTAVLDPVNVLAERNETNNSLATTSPIAIA